MPRAARESHSSLAAIVDNHHNKVTKAIATASDSRPSDFTECRSLDVVISRAQSKKFLFSLTYPNRSAKTGNDL